MNIICQVLTSKNILVRTITLWMIGFILMYASWAVSYRTLPEGVLAGRLLVSRIEIVTYELTSTFSRIFCYNLFMVCIPLVASNLFKLRGLPLGYVVLLYHWTLYGALLGTNSFLIPSPMRPIPSIDALSYGVGIYEITAYTFIVASTYGLKLRLKGSKLDIQGLPAAESAAITLSILLLAASSFYEAWQIAG
ncbi:MAG: hypothetical protein QXQ11_05070 [Candidatus Bathyarchaeia archaeon]